MTSITLSPDAGIPLRYLNRHGLVAGATGSGKTRTVQTIVEQCSAVGIPTLITDVKGDLSGISKGFPVRFWDLFGEDGLPMKTSVHEMGQQTLARLLGLNATQEGIINICFRWCEDRESPLHGIKLFDINDLRAAVGNLLDYAAEIREKHGNVTAASVGAIQRAILNIEGQGADALFGEPVLDVMDLLRVDKDGRGMVNLISADRLLESRSLYSGFMIWLLMSLFTRLPEVGDAEKPKLVVIVDEAHMVFADAPKILIETIERIVRLIRSRGVGVYFASQNALDIPEKVAAQLGNRVQHAMRAFTPNEHRAVKAVAKTFRQNTGVDTEKAMTEMGTGEALVSVIGDGGVPTPVVRTRINLPSSQLEPIDMLERIALIRRDPLRHQYGKLYPTDQDAYVAFTARLAAEANAEHAARRDRPSWRDETMGASA
ncbi:helicase HerA-like domain-containing protein [Bosea massiliensis]|uniref:Helicase HerA-like domain-containing protein n=1 Tax=Bosea massiliensis TaxID=151419 RepID=A0ABW0P9I1_9HYPH